MFGRSYLLDMYDCTPGVCDSLELHYRFLEELVYKIGMTPMSQPLVIHGPVKFDHKVPHSYKYEYPGGPCLCVGCTTPIVRQEVYPDKAGVSAWQPLIESGIQIHSLEPSHFSSLDVYTCGNLDPLIVFNFAREKFGFTSYEERLIERGKKFGKM